jgi:hypothetical protein
MIPKTGSMVCYLCLYFSRPCLLSTPWAFFSLKLASSPGAGASSFFSRSVTLLQVPRSMALLENTPLV